MRALQAEGRVIEEVGAYGALCRLFGGGSSCGGMGGIVQSNGDARENETNQTEGLCTLK